MNEMFWKHEYLTLKEVEIPKLIRKFLKDLKNLPIEHVSWVGEHSIRKARMGEVNIAQSSMIFLPEITKLKFKWEKRL